MSSGRTEVKPQTWLCDFLLHCRGENKLQRGGDNFSVSITHLHCKPILPASGAWRGINQNVSLYVVACNVPTIAAAEVGFLSRSPSFSPHSCVLWSCTGVRSWLHPRYKVTALKSILCVLFQRRLNRWQMFEPQAVEDAVISFPLRVVNAALLFLNAHDPKRRSDISSKCYEASNTIWWIVKGGRNIFKNGRDDVQK